MLTKTTKKVELTAKTTVQVTAEDGTVTEVEVRGYNAKINSEDPAEMTTSEYWIGKGKDYYADHRTEINNDYFEFQKEAYALQEEMFAALETE